MESLIGKVVTGLSINEDYNVLRFSVDSGNYYFVTSGDCCNSVYWNDISGVESLLGQEVLNVVRYGSTECEGGSQGYLEDYMITLETSKGRCDFIYRNDHNGYYGGSCDELKPGKLFIHHPKKLTPEDLAYIAINEDYSI